MHQHNWYASTACPHRTKSHWEEFKQKVDAKIAEIRGGVDEQPEEVGQTVTVSLHGYECEIRGRNENGTTLIAIRDLLRQMGYSAEWKDGKILVEYRK
ncbi:hypothetical protein ACLGL1_09405 [Peptococcus simiae]|uniref:hypothetical protein n=1 Tax=Peptococcus simiae TaxID=1643805 RepID=UPI00397FFAEF